MPCVTRRSFSRLAAGLTLCTGLILPVAVQAQATNGQPDFVDATGIAVKLAQHGGNAFAAAQTVTSPYGGSYSVDTAQWSGSSGTVVVSYSHFKLANGWAYNGSWSYTGSVTPSSILNGTLTGSWVIAGLDLGNGPMDLSFNMKVVFSNGQATLTMIYTLPATVADGTTIPASTQTTTLQLKQQDMVGFLL